MDTCICMAEPFCYLPETITTLLIGYTSIENKKLKKSYVVSFFVSCNSLYFKGYFV